MIKRWTATILVLGLAGCAGEGTTAEPAEPTAGAEQPPGPAQPWEEMSFEQRKQYMQDQVLPTMKAEFQGFDAETYADFGCETCHGSDPEAREFDMPNPDLPQLPSPESSEWQEMTAEPSAVVAFMMNDVVPTMASTLGEQPFDPETGEGFGCFECHTMEEPTSPGPGSGLDEDDSGPSLEDDFPGE